MPPPRSDRAATLESVPFSRKGKAHASAFCISRQTPQEAGEVHKRRRFCTQVSSKRLRQPARCCLYQLGGVQRHLRRCGYKQPPAQRPTWLGQGRFATSDSEKGWLYVQDSPRGGFHINRPLCKRFRVPRIITRAGVPCPRREVGLQIIGALGRTEFHPVVQRAQPFSRVQQGAQARCDAS